MRVVPAAGERTACSDSTPPTGGGAAASSSVIISGMSRTVVAVNAHPDDEALLMAGTLAKAAAAGHRVVLVVATDGDLGLTSQDFRGVGGAEAATAAPDSLGRRRLAELQSSAAAIGAARVVHLGYGDSGMVGDVPPDMPGQQRFLRADPSEAAGRLADILTAERADVLIGYDANGGYGHRDHVRVHEVARLAAGLAHTPRLLEATVPRDMLARAVALAGRVYRFPPEFDASSFARSFSPAAHITHRIDVRRFVAAKRAAMAAHASQAAADGGADRTLAAFLRIPNPLYGLVFGREWYVDATGLPPGTPTSRRAAGGVFRGLPGAGGSTGTLKNDIFAG